MREAPWKPWRFVLWFGVASLLADIAQEGARSLTGPYLASLGASAVLVGAVTGAGEAIGLAGRLVSGPLADRTRAYWPMILGGYALTVLTVPFLGLTSVLWIVAGLILAERAGKALRRPAKDVLLAQATAAIGRGKGFAVHEALDQVGAVAGPLAVAAAFAVTGRYAPTFGMLALPGLAVLVLLLWIRRRVPDPSVYEADESASAPASTPRDHPPRGLRIRSALGSEYWWYLAFAATASAGLATFGILSFHLVQSDLAGTAAVPVVYAVAMGVDALAALGAGALFDRRGPGILAAVPILAAAVPALAFASSAVAAVAGVLIWAAVLGIQESVLRAAVADLIPRDRRGTAYGILAAALGVAALVGGTVTGALYESFLPLLVAVVGGIELIALALFVVWFRRRALAVA